MRIWNVNNVAERWKEAYTDRHGNWLFADAERREKIYSAILAVGDDAAKIDKVIGNDSWTKFYCAECGTNQFEGVSFNDWGGGVVVCSNCLRRAVAMTTRIPNEE